MSIAIAGIVLIREIISLPASSAAFAKSAIFVTFGLNFVISGSPVAFLTAETTLPIISVSVPNAMPPSLTFGQETLISSAAIPSESSSRRRATSQ